jgi:hypothetical protein
VEEAYSEKTKSHKGQELRTGVCMELWGLWNYGVCVELWGLA